MDILLYIFAFCCLATLILMVIATGVSNKQRLKAEQTKPKFDALKKELAEISIQQLIILNRDAKKGKISQQYYSVSLVKIIEQLKESGIDASTLALIPFESFPDKKELIYKALNLSNEIHDNGQFNDEEFNEQINELLDNMNKK